ncbi:MAG TPA: roadblock/LC7 domain-containing protein [Pelovirga sp.]|nr:roadblock/LC7 domain-containing protein [Pelovirga sp.]
MATAKDFVVRISKVSGVSGCLLIKRDGTLVGRAIEDPENYTILMQISDSLAHDIQGNIGANNCRSVSFGCQGDGNFYVFPIDNYLLGVLAQAGTDHIVMLDEVYRLIGRVTTGSS